MDDSISFSSVITISFNDFYFRFKVYDWMHVLKHGGLPQVMDSEEYDAAPSMEGLLVFLATLIGVRTNLCEC